MGLAWARGDPDTGGGGCAGVDADDGPVRGHDPALPGSPDCRQPDATPGTSDDRCYDQDRNGDGQDDGLLYDRSAGAMWSGAPDGAISILTDVLLVLAQTGHNCLAEP